MWEHCIELDQDKCTGCGTCEEVCPGDIIRMQDDTPVFVYADECWHCGACAVECPVDAIRILPWIPK